MGGNAKRGGGDRVLESRHLVGLFLGVVLLCGVFFTLGYVMGRTQYGGSVHAEGGTFPVIAPSRPSPARAKETPPVPAPANTEWDFYAKKDTTHIEPAPKSSAPGPRDTTSAPAAVPAVVTKTQGAPPVATTKTVAAPGKTPASYQSPRLPKGAIVLQVAALKREGDALKMADEIQQKKYPAFVIMLPSDSLYHVQVGPYTDEKSAENAKRTLEQIGFKSIIKR
ncbi:MAG TPA: SPOR domain-containing protein [Candidatus Limnocylindria bacterium]|nr:SPOR domain-containing protein [Candidatus Limnocylindria bacterium]